MQIEFSNKVALVTGGGLGIGRATALAFARAGASVIVSDLDKAHGEETVSAILATNGKAAFVQCDVSDEEDVQRLMNSTIDIFGRLDCAFNNAGISSTPEKIENETRGSYDRTMAVNLAGVWLCMKYEIPLLLAQGGGAIVNTASAAGLSGTEQMAIYTASKHGVIGLTRSVALDYAKQGIRINAVCPGAIRTALFEHVCSENPGMLEAAIANHPIGRIGEPEEVAQAVIWLASDAASNVIGVALPVDGGYLV